MRVLAKPSTWTRQSPAFWPWTAKRAARYKDKPDTPGSRDGAITATPFRLCKITDLPEPSDEWKAADQALKDFADELVAIGGMQLMVDVYDEAVERHNYRAVSGVSASWDCRHGWYH